MAQKDDTKRLTLSSEAQTASKKEPTQCKNVCRGKFALDHYPPLRLLECGDFFLRGQCNRTMLLNVAASVCAKAFVPYNGSRGKAV
jgi:hypothetical protein